MHEFFKEFLDGQDVPTLIGFAGVPLPMGKTAEIAMILVDYADMPSEKDRSDYDKFIEELWRRDYFKEGFELSRTDTGIRVSSRTIMSAVVFEDGEEHHLRAPSYYVDCVGDPPFIKRFEDLREMHCLWCLHIRTATWSYLYLVRHPDNSIINKSRKPKQELNFGTPP